MKRIILSSLLVLNSFSSFANQEADQKEKKFRFSVQIESSGPYKVGDDLTTDDINGIKNAFVGTWSERHQITRQISQCNLETCDSLFMTPIMDFKNELIDKYGQEAGNSYFLTMFSGMLVNESQTLRDNAYAFGKFALSFEEKMFVAQNLGEMMLRNYDNNRTDVTNDASNGIVSQEDVFKAIRENVDAGVCRDIATAQAMVLHDLGLNNVYVVAFSTIDGGHATVMTQDEEDPSRIVHLNYGEATAQSLQSGMFNQDTSIPETGVVMSIFDAQGNSIDKVPSELGYVIMKTAGLDTEKFAAGVSRRGIHLVNMDYLSGKMKVTAMAAKTASGNEVLGIGTNYNLYETENLDMSIGAAVQSSRREKEGFSLDNTGFFVGVETALRSNKVDLGFLKRNFVEVEMASGVYVGNANLEEESLEKSGSAVDSIFRLTSSYQSEIEFGDNILFKTRASIHSAVMNSNVRDEESRTLEYTGYTLTNSLIVSLGEKYAMEFENKIYVRKNSKTMSNTFYAKSKDGRNLIEIGYDSPLSKNPHPWMIGAQKEARIGYQRKVGEFNFKIKYTRLIDLDEGFYNLEVNGRF